jgi:HEAT repeat protein
VRDAAAKGLASIGQPAAGALVSAFRNGWLDDWAVGALTRYGLPDDPELRAWHAVYTRDWQTALAQGPAAVEPLLSEVDALHPDPERFVTAAGLLGQIGDARAVDPLLRALHQAAGDYNAYKREAIAQALGGIGDARAVEPLIEMLKGKDKHSSTMAGEALRRIGEPAVERLAEELLHADSVSVRWDAAEILGQIGGRRAASILVEAFAAGQIEARHYSVWRSLRAMGEPAVEPLVAALIGKRSDVRSSAAEALGNIGDPRAVGPLVAALSDEDWGVRRGAAGALGEIGDPRALGPLVAALADNDSDVRKAVTQALVKIGDLCAVEPLAALMTDDNGDVRRAAAEALGKIGDARAVESLVAVLKDGDIGVRRAAAVALGRLGDARAVEPLVAALRDSDDNVRQAAATALVGIGRPAIEPLAAILEQKDWFTWLRAAEVLARLGWESRNADSAARYLALRGEWDRCVSLGAPAVRPLIELLMATEEKKTSMDQARSREVARALVRIYQSGKLDTTHLQLILAERSKIASKHTDFQSMHKDIPGHHQDCALGFSADDHIDVRHHTDLRQHTDQGVDVDFPL